MKFLQKFRKIWWLLNNTNIWQTLFFHRHATCPRSSQAHVRNYSLINISKSAIVNIEEHGHLYINMLNLKRKRIRPCTFWIGDNARFSCKGFSMYEGASVVLLEGASLTIGRNSYMNDSLIQCAGQITIGDDCAIAGDVLIQDTDFHPMLDEKGEERSYVKPINIGNHVWICAKATILKGVTIGDGSVVAAGSVVTRDVPPRCLVGGNPARIIRQNIDWR